MLRKTDKFNCNNRGQAMVEFALVLPIFLLLLCGIMDFGRVLNGMLTVNQAAREAARVASVSGSSSDAIAAAKKYGSNFKVDLVPAVPDPGQDITVTVTSPVTIITPIISPFFAGNSYTARGQAVMVVEE